MELVSLVLDITSFAIETGVVAGKVGVKAAPLKRECHVEISNESSRFTLCDPSFYARSGFCAIPLPPTIRPLSSGDALFIKAPVVARGAVGVFTYDLFNNDTQSCLGRMAVMYKVPFDLNFKRIKYAIGVFDVSTQCNKQLFRQMSRSTDQRFVKGKAKNSSLSHKEDAVTLRATISTSHTPVMRIQVSDE